MTSDQGSLISLRRGSNADPGGGAKADCHQGIDNLGLGRPDTLEIIFDRQVRRGRQRSTQGTFNTKVITRGTEVTMNAFYRRSRIKQYLKDSRALRVETVINDAYDIGCQRRLHNLDEVHAHARAINNRLLDTERAGQACVLANPVFERIAHPSVTADGRRATAMRFGDSRVQALAGALAVTVCAVTGITNRSLRALMAGLLGTPYGTTQASYDLARLRRNGLITRRPHANTYDLTPDGLAFAIFYTKVHDRVLTPLFAAGQPQARPAQRRPAHNRTNNRRASCRRPAACRSLKTRLNCQTPSDKGSLAAPGRSMLICLGAAQPPGREPHTLQYRGSSSRKAVTRS